MSRNNKTVSKGQVTVAWLVQQHITLTWQESVALVLEIAEVVGRSIPPRLPPYQQVALGADGSVRFLQAAARRGDSLTLLVDILRALLPTDSPREVWDIASIPGADSPAHDTVEHFAAALRALEQGDRDRRDILASLHRRVAKELAELEAKSLPSIDDTNAASGRLDSTPEFQTAGAVQTGVLQTVRIEQVRLADPTEPEPAGTLIEMVRRHGLLQPVLVRPLSGDVHELVSGRTWLAAAKAAGLSEVPCRICHLDDAEVAELGELDRTPSAPAPLTSAVGSRTSSPVVEPALAEIADSLNAATSCWQLSTESSERPYTRTLSEVTKVELQRASWLVHGLRLLTQPPPLHQANRSLGTILEQVFQATRPERRLSGVKLLANLADASIMVQVDEPLVLLAYGGMVQGTLALVRHASHPVVRCEVVTTRTAAIVMLSQESAEMSASLITHFFDETFHNRPGGYGAAVALAVTKRVMELHGGTASVESLHPIGCRVSAQLPLTAAHSEAE